MFEHKRYLQPGLPIFKKMPKLVFYESIIIQKVIKLFISILYYLTHSIYEQDSIQICSIIIISLIYRAKLTIFVDGFISHKLFRPPHFTLSFFWIKRHLWPITSTESINALHHICRPHFFPLNFAKKILRQKSRIRSWICQNFFDKISITKIKPNYDCNFDN